MAPLKELFRQPCTPPQRERALFYAGLAEFGLIASVLQSLARSSDSGFVLLEGLAQ